MAVGIATVAATLASGCSSDVRAGLQGHRPAEGTASDSRAAIPTPGLDAASHRYADGSIGCTRDQLVLGQTSNEVGLGTFYSAADYVHQPFRNVGRACILEVPAHIDVPGPDQQTGHGAGITA